MKIFYAFAFIMLLHGTVATAQDFRPGYIVHGNDTTRGWVDYKTNKAGADQCVFKTAKSGDSKTYQPTEIDGYGIYQGRYYEAFQPMETTTRVFGRVLAKGTMSLLRHGETYYLLKEDTIVHLPLPVTRAVEMPDPGGRGKTLMAVTEKKYIGIMNFMMNDCGIKADEATYADNPLTRVVNRYNTCRGDVRNDKNKRKFVEFNWIVSGGYQFSNMSIDSLPSSAQMSTRTAFGGAGLELIFPRIFDRLSITFDVAYVKAFYQGLNERPFSGRFYHDDITLKVSYLKFPIGLKYNFKQAGRTPFLRAGGFLSSVMKTTLKTRRESEYDNQVSSYDVFGGSRLRSARGMFVAAGYDYQVSDRWRLFGEVRYERGIGFFGTGIQPNSSLSSINGAVGLIF